VSKKFDSLSYYDLASPKWSLLKYRSIKPHSKL
jgi:hypothetical protein